MQPFFSQKRSPRELIIKATRADGLSYAPSLDGLRGIAILGVLIFHALPGTLKGGFTGVDVFFVLSGYLITSVILHEIRNETFSMREFYLRRVQRLMPNAVLTVLFTVALSSIVVLPSDAMNVAKHGIWTIFNLSNIYIWRTFGGYWGDSAARAPLLHTWSLAVEEQFYLLWPAVLLFLSRRRHLFGLSACFALASLALSTYGTYRFPVATFYLLPTRLWEPLLGGLLSIFVLSVHRPFRNFSSPRFLSFAGWAGLAAIVAGFLFISDSDRFPGLIALVPTFGTLGVLLAVADGAVGPVRFLSRPFLVLTGKLSYSLYLWHWPLIVIGREYAELIGQSQRLGTLIGAAVGVVLAAIAYWTVEAPLRRRGAGRHRRLAILAAGFSICVLACTTLALRRPVSDSLNRFDRPEFYGNLYTVGPWDDALVKSSKRYEDVFFPTGQPLQPGIWRSGGIVHQWGTGSPRVVVLGSSHALMYGKLIDEICKQHGLSVAFLSADANPVFFHTSEDPSSMPPLGESFDVAREEWVSKWNPDVVLVIDRWDLYEPQQFRKRLQVLLTKVTPHTRNVILFSQIPVLRLGQEVNLREYATWYFHRIGRLPKIDQDKKVAVRKSAISTIEAASHDFPNVHLLRVDEPFYMEDGSVKFSYGRSFLYADDNHLTQAGAELVHAAIAEAIVATTSAANR